MKTKIFALRLTGWAILSILAWFIFGDNFHDIQSLQNLYDNNGLEGLELTIRALKIITATLSLAYLSAMIILNQSILLHYSTNNELKRIRIVTIILEVSVIAILVIFLISFSTSMSSEVFVYVIASICFVLLLIVQHIIFYKNEGVD